MDRARPELPLWRSLRTRLPGRRRPRRSGGGRQPGGDADEADDRDAGGGRQSGEGEMRVSLGERQSSHHRRATAGTLTPLCVSAFTPLFDRSIALRPSLSSLFLLSLTPCCLVAVRYTHSSNLGGFSDYSASHGGHEDKNCAFDSAVGEGHVAKRTRREGVCIFGWCVVLSILSTVGLGVHYEPLDGLCSGGRVRDTTRKRVSRPLGPGPVRHTPFSRGVSKCPEWGHSSARVTCPSEVSSARPSRKGVHVTAISGVRGASAA